MKTNIVLICICLFLFLLPSATADISTGLVGYWKFDENSGSVVADSSGHGLDGAFQGTWVSGYSNNAIYMPTSNNYVSNIGDVSTFAFIQNTANFTISTWFKLDDNSAAIIHMLGHNSLGCGHEGTCFTYDNRSGNHALSIYVTNGAGSPIASAGANNAFNDTKWHLITATGDGTNAKAYVDGSLIASAAITGTAAGNSAEAYSIGDDTHGDHLEGSVDEYRIYNRALTQADINALYYCQPPSLAGRDWKIDGGTNCDLQQITDTNDVSLKGWWKFDEGTGTTAADSSGNANTGTISGSPTWFAGSNAKFGADLNFDGVDDNANVGNVGNLNSVSFWVNPSTTTQKIIDLNGSATIEISSGTVTANNFASPTIYVDGVASSTVSTGWHHIAITTGTSITASSLVFGKVGATYFSGQLDDIRIYSRALTATDVNNLYKQTFVSHIGNNLDIRNGQLYINSSYGVDIASGKHAIFRVNGNNNRKLIIQRLGRLIFRK